MVNTARTIISSLMGTQPSEKDMAQLYDKYAAHVRAVLFKMGAGDDLDDLVQDCFVKAWKGLANYRGESSMKTWITRIAVNSMYDAYRKRGREPDQESDEEVLAALPAEAPTAEHDHKQAIELALSSLSPDHRTVLVLFVYEENSVEEISETLNIPPGTVKSRLHHAKEKVRQLLTKRGVSI